MQYLSFLFMLSGVLSFIQSPSWARNRGSWTSQMVAESSQTGIPTQHFGCGISIREMFWTKTITVCSTGWDSYLYSQQPCYANIATQSSKINGLQVIFCNQNNPSKKIIKQLASSDKNSGSWRSIECPQNFLISGVAVGFDFDGREDLGMNAIKIKCGEIGGTKKTAILENSSSGSYQKIFEAAAGYFLRGFGIKSSGQNILGAFFTFDAITEISDINFIYQPLLPIFEDRVKLGQQSIINNISTSSEKQIEINGQYSFTSSYILDNQRVYQSNISTLLQHIDYSPNLSLASTSLFTKKVSSFIFGGPIKNTFTMNEKLSLQVQKKSITIVSLFVNVSSCVIPFSAQITYSNIQTKSVVSKIDYSGHWQGVLLSPTLTTEITHQPLNQQQTNNTTPLAETQKQSNHN